jgi:hypothetical protein
MPRAEMKRNDRAPNDTQPTTCALHYLVMPFFCPLMMVYLQTASMPTNKQTLEANAREGADGDHDDQQNDVDNDSGGATNLL